MPRRRLDIPKAKDDICTALRSHSTVRAACAFAGVDENSFYRWIKLDRDFRDAVKKAEAASDVRLTSLIVKEAQEGTWTAAAWLLERHPRTKKEWRKTDEVNVRNLSTEQLVDIASECDRRIESPGDQLALTQGAAETESAE